jgi:hypothetical protein
MIFRVVLTNNLWPWTTLFYFEQTHKCKSEIPKVI